MIQGFLLAWLNLTPYFRVWSEQEWGGGFVDLYLAPFYARYRDMRHAYLIELKYLKRGEDSPAQAWGSPIKAGMRLHHVCSDKNAPYFHLCFYSHFFGKNPRLQAGKTSVLAHVKIPACLNIGPP